MTALRPPDQVMRLARLGAFHQTRLSFMRVLLRRMRAERWRFDRPVRQIAPDGTGRAVYRAIGPRRTYSLVAFAHDLPDDQRSDRVIAEAWDATFALVDGTPTPADLDRLAANVPLQEAGRVSDGELVLSRANRSVRLWSHVVDHLAAGRQPDPARIERVGYLMRTTAVYGSGKFGAADRAALAGRPLMGGPFRAEMLAVWLIRAFCLDLVEHMAAAEGGARAVRLDPDLRRRFGIGNSTGLGMAPFLVNHPGLLHAWIAAREAALARVRAVGQATGAEAARFGFCLERARRALPGWQTDDAAQAAKLGGLAGDLYRLSAHLETGVLDRPQPWDALYRWAEGNLGLEAQELLVSLMLEPYGALVDDLAETMAVDETDLFQIDGAVSAGQMRRHLARDYGWALATDHAAASATARFWYVSEAKLEPRLGTRAHDAGAALELPLDIARDAAAFAETLAGWPDDAALADVLASRPDHRRIARRAQIAAKAPYAEVRDNLIAADLLPVDMLRCKLSFFGATRFDPRSDRWLRIAMYQGAPFPDELAAMPADDWIYGSAVPADAVAAG